MSDVLNPNYNNYPEQVEENKRDIKALSCKFKTSEVLNSSSSVIDKSTTNIPERCNIGEIIDSLIYSQNGLVFKIVAITGNKVFIDFYSDLSNQGGGSYSTQNMLINPAFIINQDAMQDYSGDGIYTADQWMMESMKTIVSPIQTGGAIFRNNGTEEHFIQQIVEVSDELNTIGKPHTASVELENGTKAHVTITPLAGTDILKKISFEGGSISLEWDATEDFFIYRVYANAGVTLNIKNTMLVPSSLPGIFVPNSKEIELEKCQYFYEKIDISNLKNKYQIYKRALSSYYFYDGKVYFQTRKRTIPNIKIFSSKTNTENYLFDNNQSIDVECVISYQTTQNFFVSNRNGNMSTNDNCSGYFIADARIY